MYWDLVDSLSRLTLFFRRLQFHFDCLKHREEFGKCAKSPPFSNRRSRGKKQSTLLRKANFRILRLMSSNAHRPFKSTFRIFSLSPFLFLLQILCCLFFAKTEKRTFGQGNSFHGLGKGVIMPHRRGGFCNLQVLHFTLPLNTCRKVAPKHCVFSPFPPRIASRFSTREIIQPTHQKVLVVSRNMKCRVFGPFVRHFASLRTYRLFWHWLNAFFLGRKAEKIISKGFIR